MTPEDDTKPRLTLEDLRLLSNMSREKVKVLMRSKLSSYDLAILWSINDEERSAIVRSRLSSVELARILGPNSGSDTTHESAEDPEEILRERLVRHLRYKSARERLDAIEARRKDLQQRQRVVDRRMAKIQDSFPPRRPLQAKQSLGSSHISYVE